MISNFGARTTFYDMIGYLMPGILSLGILWMYWYVLIDPQTALFFASFMVRHVGITSIGLVMVGYAMGHLVNSLSSLLLEKWIFRKAFKDSKNWFGRAKEASQVRANQIYNNAQEFLACLLRR